MYAIDNQSRTAVFEQIIEQTERFVLTGVLAAHQPMPSVRALSVELSVNPNTIQKAYSDLERRGIIYVTPGRGSFVSPSAAEVLSQERLELLTVIGQHAHECALAGIEKEKVIEAVENGYRRNGGNGNDQG